VVLRPDVRPAVRHFGKALLSLGRAAISGKMGL
jgi:hypothetical protein